MDKLDKDQLERLINKYKSIKLQGVAFPKLLRELRKDFRYLPFTTAKLKKGGTIERARINLEGEIFNSENQLSYRTDIRNITKYGRANIPHSSMFYGSIVSDHIANPRIVNIFETDESFRNHDSEDRELLVTVGKWKIKEDFEIAEITFSDEVRKKIPSVQKAYEYHIQKIKQDHPKNYEYFIRIMEFFSDEFAKKDITSDSDYKLSAAYTELALMANLKGVTYPSVRTEFEGINVALPIPVVDEFLELEIAGMFLIKKIGKKSVMDNASITTDLGEMNSNFTWKDMQKLSDQQINEILLKE